MEIAVADSNVSIMLRHADSAWNTRNNQASTKLLRTVANFANATFWDVTPCGSCKNGPFGGAYRLPHQDGKNMGRANNDSSIATTTLYFRMISVIGSEDSGSAAFGTYLSYAFSFWGTFQSRTFSAK
jgi:hypothetical protein